MTEVLAEVRELVLQARAAAMKAWDRQLAGGEGPEVELDMGDLDAEDDDAEESGQSLPARKNRSLRRTTCRRPSGSRWMR